MNALALLLTHAVLAATGAGVLAISGFARSPRLIAGAAGIAWFTGVAVMATIGAIAAPLGAHVVWIFILVPGVAVTAGALRLSNDAPPSRRVRGARRSLPTRLATAVLAGGTGVLAILYLWAFANVPLEEYDGWAIWGMKAHALASLGSADAAVFASQAYLPSHLEYPLAIPFVDALPLVLAGTYDSNLIVMQGVLIGLSGVTAIWSLLRDRVRPIVLWAWLAAIMATPAVAVQLGTGYADVQLALFVAAGLVCLTLWAEGEGTPLLALGSIFLAAAALAKNEGVLFAGAAIASVLVVAAGRRRALVAGMLGVAGAVLPWHAWTLRHGLHGSDYDLGSSFDPSYVLGRLGRIRLTLDWFGRRVLLSGDWIPLPILTIAAVAAGAALARSRAAVIAALFAGLSFAGLVWIYLISPLGVDDYLDSNGVRTIASVVLGTAALGSIIVDDLLGGPESRSDVSTRRDLSSRREWSSR